MIKPFSTQPKLQNNPNNPVGTDPFLTINTHLLAHKTAPRGLFALSGMVARVCPATQSKLQQFTVALLLHRAFAYQGEARLAPTVGLYWGVL
jgi:hypothetical protein